MSNPNQQPEHSELSPQTTQPIEQLGSVALTGSQGVASSPDVSPMPAVGRRRDTDWRAIEGLHPGWLGFDNDGNPK